MTALPPSPFLAFADTCPRSADPAAASNAPADAAANLFDDSYGIGPMITNDLPIIRAENEHTRQIILEHESSMTTGGHQEAPAVVEEPATAGATDEPNFIGEIFYHARRLINEHNAKYRRFRLDEAAFMEAIEPPPLFLQRRA